MKNLIIIVFSAILISCNKEDKSVTTELNSSTYDFSKDSCGFTLLRGIYVSNTNVLDTILIDTNIHTYVNGANQVFPTM